MKTKKYLSWCCGAVTFLALLPLASLASETTAEAKAQKSEPSTHVLFTGTDIRVLYDGVLHRVRGVDGGSFIIKVKDKEVEIPMGKNPEKLKLAQVQALTERSASLAKFKYERTYTAANDPFRKGAKGMLATTGMQEQLTWAQNVESQSPPKIYDGRKGEYVDNPYYAMAQQKTLQANQSAGGNMGSADFYANEMMAELAKELFDAVEVQFEVSSAKPIHSPYVVIMAKYHEKDDPKHPQNWLFAKALAAIDSSPRKESVMEGGFPPGFVVDKLQVHLYEKGQEIATDLSENRAPLTRDEAHEYLVIDHVSAHKTDTLPARVALTKMPEDWATHQKDESFRKTYYVKVDKDGRPVGWFEDESGRIKVGDSYYESVLSSLLFLPALEHGKAVDSMARVQLSELPM